MNVQKQAATAIAAGEMHRHRHGPSFVMSLVLSMFLQI